VISRNRELALRSLPLFDVDQNGLVSMAEVARVAAVARATADQLARAPGIPRKTDL
jgi:Ca2+-binding EF-hand superfamily protein